MLLLVFAPCLAFAFSSNNSMLMNKFSANPVSMNLAMAVNVVIDQIYLKHFSTTNLISASIHSERHVMKDFLSSILRQNTETNSVRICTYTTVMCLPSMVRRKSNFILLDGIETFRVLNDNITPGAFMFSGYYLFVLVSGAKAAIDEIFATMWSKNIFNVDVIFEDSDAISLMTFMPFLKGSKCGNKNPVLINEFYNGSFRSNIKSLFPEKFNNLQNCPIKIVTFEDTLAVFKVKRKNGSSELHGFDIELLQGLSTALNFKAEVNFLETFEPWGFVTQNGTATGALGELVKGNANIGIGNYFLKYNRLRVLDSSVTYSSFPLVFIIPPGQYTSPFKKLIQPFQAPVWIFLILIFLFGFVTITMINFRSKSAKNFVFGTDVKQPIANMFVIILGGSQPKLPKRNFARFLLMMFVIFCLVQRSIYQGSLFIFLQSERREKEIQSFEEMVLHVQCIL